MKKMIAVATALAAGLAVADQAPAPAAAAPAARDFYVTDFYAPPPDWIPKQAIRDYSLNTRVPDLFWLKYGDAYTLALRIRPLAEKQLEKDFEVGLIDRKRADDARAFRDDREKNADCRTIGVFGLAVPADDFVSFSFKMKARGKAAGAEVLVYADGVATVSTAKDADADTPCRDGFKAYKATFPAKKGRKLTGVRIVVPASQARDPDEEYVFTDLCFHRAAPKARFDDLPPRRWIPKAVFDEGREATTNDVIPDIVAYVNDPSNAVDSIDLPVSGYVLRPQTDKEKDSGFKAEKVRATINGRACDALRVTLEKGSRCYLKFPAAFNALDYNTLTFYTKIDIAGPVNPRKLCGDTRPSLYGTDAATVNSFFDTFSFGVHSATKDPVDWCRFGVAQGLASWHWQDGAAVDPGWRAVALDLVNSDPAGNKNTYLPEVTHWCFYYANAKIPEGTKVVVTIAAPKVSSGLMLAGGELGKYRDFLEAVKAGRLVQKDFGGKDGRRYLGPPATNRLEKPLPLVRNHMPLFEIIRPPAPAVPAAYAGIVDRALGVFEDTLRNKCGLHVKIDQRAAPTTNDNVKIFLGSPHFMKVDAAQCRADLAAMKGRAGCAIRTRGKSVYVYGGDFNYAKEARGIANGLYTLLENNTDVIFVQTPTGRRASDCVTIVDLGKDSDLDLVWGSDYINVPPLKYWSVYGNHDYMERNFDFPDDWAYGTWTYGGRRQHTTNHWWGYGTEPNGPKDPPNDRWGLGEDGKRMRPGCYSGHPCLVNVLENAKAAYLAKAYAKRPDNAQCPAGQSYVWRQQDTFGLWVEDTLRICVCDKCLSPIRLADGSTVKPEDGPIFRSAQFYANACAMINAVNVHARRDMKIESIAYFWMSAIPPFEISRNYEIRFCPYIRKNYFVPIFAPCNDLFWRDFNRWSQLNVGLGVYEYFLYVATRPWTDVFQFDFPEEVARRLSFATPESDTSPLAAVEHWTLARYFWEPSSDPRELRRRYIWRVYREAAPAVEKFYCTLHNFIHENMDFNQPIEFEDESQVGTLACLTPAKRGRGSVADELTRYLDDAEKAVRHPMSAKMLRALRKNWDAYIARAKTYAETLK